MKAFSIVLVLAVCLISAVSAAPAPAGPDAATLTLQFDNSLKDVSEAKRKTVIDTLAKYVFLVPSNQVTYVSGINQGGALTKQSVATFKAVGPTTNRQRVLANCEANTKGRWLGLRDSVATAEVKKSTDSWFPNDKVEIQKATCAQA